MEIQFVTAIRGIILFITGSGLGQLLSAQRKNYRSECDAAAFFVKRKTSNFGPTVLRINRLFSRGINPRGAP